MTHDEQMINLHRGFVQLGSVDGKEDIMQIVSLQSPRSRYSMEMRRGGSRSPIMRSPRYSPDLHKSRSMNLPLPFLHFPDSLSSVQVDLMDDI